MGGQALKLPVCLLPSPGGLLSGPPLLSLLHYISGRFSYPDCPQSIFTSVLLMPKLYPQ